MPSGRFRGGQDLGGIVGRYIDAKWQVQREVRRRHNDLCGTVWRYIDTKSHVQKDVRRRLG
jgi:hypothetical protein